MVIFNEEFGQSAYRFDYSIGRKKPKDSKEKKRTEGDDIEHKTFGETEMHLWKRIMEASTNTVFRPPVLDGSNYALWKVKMRVFIKSIEERAWQRVLDGWSPPNIEDADGDTRLKPESTWTIDEVQTSNFNSKALNAIFSSVDTRMFNLITNCVCAKEAWDILQKHCEGSESPVETTSNEAHSLGDPMSNERLVNKVLRSLPEKFNVKVCAIEESKDTSTINLDELMSSLRTFEMNLDLQKKDKGKTIALEVSTDSYDEILQISKKVNESDLGEDSISLITKKFGDYLKKMRGKKKIGQKSVLPNITTSAKAQKFTSMKGQFRPKIELQIQSNVRNLDSVQCRECSGFGHYANECANRLRRNKGMAVTLSDEESDDDQGSNESENHTSLSAVIKEKRSMQINPLGVATGVAIPGRNISSNSVCLNSTTLGESSQSENQEVDDDEVTLESVQTMYEELYEDWIKRNKVNAILSKENTELKSQVSRLEVILSKKDLELCKVKEELEEATQILAKLNSSSSKLDSLLMIGKNDKAGLGYTNHQFEIGESSNTERKPTVFVKGSAEISYATYTEKGVSSKRQISTKKSKSRKRHFICHYCFRPGHIKPYCFKLRDDYKRWESEQVLPQVLYNIQRNTANRKTIGKKGIWYFDSGCSRHMTGSKDYLTDYVELRNGHVTYGGGAKGRIAGKGTLNVDGLPSLHNVLYVEGLNSNLISINFKTLKNLGKYDAVRGMPNLSSGIPYVCGACQKGKQTRVSHQVLQYFGTTRCLELLHMDLMGPMEVESLGDLTGKTIEDDIDGLLNISETLPNTDVAPGVVTPETTPALAESNDEPGEYTENDDVVTNEGIDIPSKIQKNHPSSQIIGEAFGGMQTRRKEKVDYRKMMGLELEQFVRNDVWDLVPRPDNVNVIGTKWIFKNKTDESVRIESVRLLLAIACHMDIKLYQMDVKSAFLNGILNEEAYVSQPKGFEDPNHLNHVYKLKKALYGLKQAPRAWYGRLTEYLLDLGFKRGEMAGFDPHDIRSEMAASMGGKSPDTTPTAETNVEGM
ncbi:uncharacterized protein LOC142524011 [Primulina tabacum]|uniref:uncharacterized protein LOC142524011 n=1 Tax=Primulina tabacum TaxID=48773 RepID=UPI003F591DD1